MSSDNTLALWAWIKREATSWLADARMSQAERVKGQTVAEQIDEQTP